MLVCQGIHCTTLLSRTVCLVGTRLKCTPHITPHSLFIWTMPTGYHVLNSQVGWLALKQHPTNAINRQPRSTRCLQPALFSRGFLEDQPLPKARSLDYGYLNYSVWSVRQGRPFSDFLSPKINKMYLSLLPQLTPK